VVFVLDGCTDGTDDRLAALAAGDPRMRVLGYAKNRGKGYAVRTGLQTARGAYRAFTDVDLQFFEGLQRLAAALRAGADVVIASREYPDSRLMSAPALIGHTMRRRLQSRLFRAAVGLILPINYGDTQAGLKGMTAAVAERIVPLLSCDGFGFDCEILLACAKGGIPVMQTPVVMRCDDGHSTTGRGAGFRMLREVWRIRRAWRTRVVPSGAPAAAPVSKAA
jgi:dolichyl-phosphate beta-glucosyltransferase